MSSKSPVPVKKNPDSKKKSNSYFVISNFFMEKVLVLEKIYGAPAGVCISKIRNKKV